MKRILLSTCLLLSVGTGHADDLLFSEDFEQGISSSWLEVSPEIQVVADPSAPTNKVAALPPGSKAALHGPPVKAGDWKSAAEKSDAMKEWSDYELSFRFRVEKIEDRPEVQGNSTSLLRIGSRIHPQEDNVHEQRVFYIGAWRPKMTWRINGPRIPWFGTHEAMKDAHNIHAGPVDPAWHEVRVVHVGDRTQIYFDGKLEYSGDDERVPRGGFCLQGWPDERTDFGTVYLDDIRVKKITEGKK
jgi:hypothetical protein